METDEVVSGKQKQLKKLQREYHKLEKEIAEKEKEIGLKRPAYVTAKSEVAHIKTKLETAARTLNAAEKMAEKNDEQMKSLEAQIKCVVSAFLFPIYF